MAEHVLITGGARNIGLAVARRLKADGYAVTIVDQVEPEDPTVGDWHRIDLADRGWAAQSFQAVAAGRRFTRLVHNAGIVAPASLEETRLEDLDRVLRINLESFLVAAQAVVPAMREAGFGRIVCTSSRAALGKELRTAYAASKAGLHGMVKTWALELGRHGITVNAVGPGPIETSLFRAANPPDDPRTQRIIEGIPVRRMGQPEDVANAVAFFLDGRSGFVTGQVLYVCGGMTIGNPG